MLVQTPQRERRTFAAYTATVAEEERWLPLGHHPAMLCIALAQLLLCLRLKLTLEILKSHFSEGSDLPLFGKFFFCLC